ncbi:hypothetical protein HHI36_009685 [Cryptolaemus montrouzieri]|uniref:Uncharacterized protein n=1 Tax=Cryptolaemus montrouzieri TaxID=559131 RepID=A0ABD2MH88_9CUCU
MGSHIGNVSISLSERTESVQDSIRSEQHSMTKKTGRHPENWKANQKKERRQSGKEYMDRNGRILASRKIEGPCKETSNFKCPKQISGPH